jgi:hypothetical protein
MIDIYKAHNVDTPYIRKNYKDALGRLEAAGKITADKHRSNTFAESTRRRLSPTNQTASFETQMIPMTPQVLRRTLSLTLANLGSSPKPIF